VVEVVAVVPPALDVVADVVVEFVPLVAVPPAVVLVTAVVLALAAPVDEAPTPTAPVPVDEAPAVEAVVRSLEPVPSASEQAASVAAHTHT